MTAGLRTHAAPQHPPQAIPAKKVDSLPIIPAFLRREARVALASRARRTKVRPPSLRVPARVQSVPDPWAGWECVPVAAPAPRREPPAPPGEPRLALFAMLPEPWRRRVLRASGGSGDEPLDALAWALAPQPPRPDVLRTMSSMATSGRTLSPAASRYMDALADVMADHLAAVAAWEAARPLSALAETVAERAAALRHVDSGALRLLAADEDMIRAEAERRAFAAQAGARALRDAHHEMEVIRHDPETGEIFEPPVVRPMQLPLTPDERRAMCPRAQRRRVRREIDRADAHASAILGIVGGRRPPKGQPDFRQLYVSDWTLSRWRHRQAAGREFLAQRLLIDTATSEPICTAAEAADSGERHRRATMIALVHGLRELARRDGLVPVAVTMTLPPPYHPAPAVGGCSYDPAIPPAAMFGALQERWHRITALLRKRQIRVFGIWLPEPHEDGCPHRHAFVWCDPKCVASLEDAVRLHFPGERAADVKVLDERTSAQVQSYVLTYALKMTKAAPSSKADAPDGEEHLGAAFERFRAWKSVFGGARSWGFIGLRRGTIGRWRDLFKLNQRMEKGEAIECKRTRVILRAIQRRQHATALRLMGALCDSAERRRREPEIVGVYEERATAYGEAARVRVGIRNTRSGCEWRIKRAGIALVRVCREGAVSDVLSFPKDVVEAGVGLPGPTGGTPPPTLDVGGPLRFPPTPPYHEALPGA